MTTAAARSRQPAAARYRRISHIPVTAEEFLSGSPAADESRFRLTDQAPYPELPFENGPWLPLDLHYVTEAMRGVCDLVTPRVPRLAALGELAVVRATVTVEGGESWRHTYLRRNAVTELRLRSRFPSDRPATVQCDAALAVQDAPYATGVLLLQAVPQQQEAAEQAEPAVSRRPAPSRVARSDPRNVVLADPRFDSAGAMVAGIAPDPAHPAFAPRAAARTPLALLTEATRQAAVLTAAERHGFPAAHLIPTRWSAELYGHDVPGAPVRCRVLAGPVVRDGAGRPEATMTVDLSRADGATVATVVVALAEDC